MRVWPVVLALALPAALAGCPQFSSDWRVAAGGPDGSSPEEASVDSGSTDAVIDVVDSGSTDALLDVGDSSSIDSSTTVGDSGSADAVLDTDSDSPALQEAGADSTIGGQDGGPAVCVFNNSASTFGGCTFGP